MVCTDHLPTLQGILARWHGTATNSLANMQPFQKVQERTKLTRRVGVHPLVFRAAHPG